MPSVHSCRRSQWKLIEVQHFSISRDEHLNTDLGNSFKRSSLRDLVLGTCLFCISKSVCVRFLFTQFDQIYENTYICKNEVKLMNSVKQKCLPVI